MSLGTGSPRRGRTAAAAWRAMLAVESVLASSTTATS
jgi:hypothetical protein